MDMDIWPVVERRTAGRWRIVLMPDGWAFPLHDSNHALFGVLEVGVGNWDVTAIAPARGLPSDLSFDPNAEGTDEEVDSDDWPVLGDFGFSWVTLAELDAYDWVAMKQQCLDHGWPAELWDEGGPMHRFLTIALPWLRSLGPPDDVRLVFGFDT